MLGDAYSGHHGLFVTGERTPAGCLSHARRKFDGLVKLGETRAKRAMDHFSALYAVEKSVAGRPPDEVLAPRKAHSIGIMDQLEILLDGWIATEVPSSATYIAANYTRTISAAASIHPGRSCPDRQQRAGALLARGWDWPPQLVIRWIAERWGLGSHVGLHLPELPLGGPRCPDLPH